ncbi:MAG TPA: BREX-1 system phosphatase PglZ type A, partial [Candidatus Eremiobacteraeota bacterium]|nr:BREX-1 system phosphatase PglZ type A [Candidatus Eremiobacteraeota bacterium]
MNTEEIKKALQKKFSSPLSQGTERNIVFWYDEEKGFEDYIDTLPPDGVKLHKLDNNYFATKFLLEEEDTKSNYLIYAPFRKPENEDNWLLDIELYSSEFSADKASLIMNTLQIEGFALKPFIKKNIKFFDSKERLESLKEMFSPEWTEKDFELAMMSVACRLKHLSFSSVVRSLFIQGLNEEENRSWGEICRYPGKDAFWKSAEKDYGYSSHRPSLKGLLLTIMLTDIKTTAKVNLPSAWDAYTSGNKNSCHIFIDQWINHGTDRIRYEKIAANISEELNLKEHIKGWYVDEYIEAESFEVFDMGIILYIRNALMDDMDEYDRYLEYIFIRKSKHWYEDYKDVYNALESTISMFSFKKRFLRGFPEGSPGELFHLYINDYYQFDRDYRKFYYSIDRISGDILKKLQPVVENLYKNWFLSNLSTLWLNAIKTLHHWPAAGIEQQKDFYRNVVDRVINKPAREKVFVIISDGFRYEAGKELAGLLNQETRGTTQITAMQSVIPSYTKLGMASLLPHKEIEIDDKGKVLVDGKDSSGIAARDGILKSRYKESAAMKLKDLMDLSKEEGRELIKQYRIIYLYHDTIDAAGDDPKSENKTFTAVHDSIEELFSAVKKIVNNYGTNVYITSDHGFLYCREPLEESDKLKIENIPAIVKNRRFLLVSDNPPAGGTISIDMDYILKNSGIKAIVPRGDMRFKMQGGGANYVHGGASLQEIAVPLIKYQHVRKDKAKEKDINRPVKVELISTSRKIT